MLQSIVGSASCSLSKRPKQPRPGAVTAKSYTIRMAHLNCNLHITFAPCRNDTRLFKETLSLVSRGLFTRVHIAALHDGMLPEADRLDAQREIRRLPLVSRRLPKTLPAQLLKYAEFCWRASRYAKRVRPDVVNVHALGLLPLGVWLKFRLRAKLVYDAHELETETFGLTGLRQRLSRWVERALIRFADLVVVVGPRIRDHYQRSYAHPAVACVMNCPVSVPMDRTNLLRDELGIPASAAVFLYLGNLSLGRGILPLLAAFEAADPAERVLVLMGYGDLHPMLAKRTQISRAVFLRDAVPPERVVEYAASADVGLSLIEDSCLSYRYCLPNKLFEYIMAGLPVIVSNLPEMADLVRDTGIGEVAITLDTAGIESAMKRLLAKDRSTLKANLRSAAKRFSWEQQEEEMIRWYRDCVLPR